MKDFLRLICLVLLLGPFGKIYAQDNPPDIMVTPTSQDYGSVDVEDFLERSFAVENNGDEPLVVFGLELQGPGADSFVLTGSGGGFVVNSGQVRLINVRFRPDSFGEKTATLLIDSNDPDENPFEISLTGVGTGLPVITTDTTNYDFGSLDIGFFDSIDIEVSNAGVALLQIDTVIVSGPNDTDFAVLDNDYPISISNEAPFLLSTQFSPVGEGVRTATVQIFSNDPANPLYEIDLMGRGVAPSLSVVDSLVFGEVMAGFSKVISFEVSNTGEGILRLDSLFTRGGSSRRFIPDTLSFPITVPPGESFASNVTYSPNSEGLQESSIHLYNNDPQTPVRIIPLAGVSRKISIEYANDIQIGEDINLSINVIPGFEPDVKEFFYKAAGNESFRQGEVTGNSPEYQALIPGIEVQTQGVQFFVRLIINNRGSTRFPFVERPDLEPFFQASTFSEIEMPMQVAPRIYSMISVPAVLEDKSIASVLEDNYGLYNPRRWRLLRWEEDGGYVEYPDIQADFSTGNGFWLITNDGVTFDIENATSTDSSVPFELKLKPGWNQIGNPFAYPIQWPATTSDPRIESPVAFDGTEFQYGQSNLLPWSGYFVRNLSQDTLSVFLNPAAVNVSGKKESNAASEPVFEVRLRAAVQGGGASESSTRVGLLEGAFEGHDKADHTVAPPIGDYVRIAAVENELEYAYNYKPSDPDGQYWDINIYSTIPNQTAFVDISALGTLPNGHQLFLFDLQNERRIELDENRFTVHLSEAHSEQRFRLVAGTSLFAENNNAGIAIEPDSYKLYPNYPNPFGIETAISFRLKTNGFVQLEVFDVLGRKVATLVDEEKLAGSYTIEWDGRNSSNQILRSGMYFYKITAEDFTATKSMTIVR